MNETDKLKEIYLAGGCFWGTQKYLSNINGIVKTDVGYANGNTENPTYEEVCDIDTGHAEAVGVYYNPKMITLDFILKMYYDVINPTSLNGQGGDTGSQYRTGIYYVDEEDQMIIKNSLLELQKNYNDPVVVEVLPLSCYYLAEEYHQNYLDKNPNGYCHISKSKFEDAKRANI